MQRDRSVEVSPNGKTAGLPTRVAYHPPDGAGAWASAPSNLERRRAVTMKATLVALLLGVLAMSAAVQLHASDDSEAQGKSGVQFVGFSIVLHVADIRQSVQFYRDVLGFELHHCVVGKAEEIADLPSDGRTPYAAELRAGSQRIGLQRNSGEVRLPASGARYHFLASNLGPLLGRIEERHIAVERMVRNKVGEPLMFAVHDPDGHWLFFQRPAGGS